MHMLTVCTGLTFTCIAPAFAQEVPVITSSPDQIDLGNLCRNGRAETSFAISWHDARLGAQKAEFTLPDFVKVHASRTAANAHTKAQTEVELTIDTSNVGELAGDIRVRCGDKSHTVPIRARVLPPDPVATRVLVLSSPYRFDATGESAKFAAWRRIVAAGKLHTHYIDVRTERNSLVPIELLREVDVVLLASDGLMALRANEIAMLQGFVCGGGRLVVSASKFFAGTVKQANLLLEPFGMQMKNIEPTDFRKTIELSEDELVPHQWLAGVDTIKTYRPTPTVILDDKRAAALAKLTPEYALLAIARTTNGGEVISLGTPIWWLWCGRDKGNERLLRNMLTRPPQSRER